MLGKRSLQRSMFDAEYHFQELVGEDSFHWQLAQARDRLFRDEDFAALYCLDNGRPSVPPSLLATALLQAHDQVSDAEAQRRARLVVGWKVALGGGRCRALCSEHAAALPSATDSARPDPGGLSVSPCVGAGSVAQQGLYRLVML